VRDGHFSNKGLLSDRDEHHDINMQSSLLIYKCFFAQVDVPYHQLQTLYFAQL
jgi:hypothetical protein